jgi:adenosylcobinamide-GDP ribazoletransferase
MLGAKCSALAMLPPSSAIGALLLAHPLSRLAATSLIWRMEYVRAEGKAKPLAERMTTSEFAIASATVAIAAAVLLATGALDLHALLAALAASFAASWWLARKFARRLEGYTGDCLGAVQQLAEVVIYLAVLATLGHGALA